MPSAGPALEADIFAIFDRVSLVGSRPNEGVTRLAASIEDGEARGIFAEWMMKHGARIAQDAVGNQFACFDWAGKDAPWIFAGSHLDTQPRGGRFDGTLGVLSAGAAALGLHRAVETGRLLPARNLAIVNWTNEEGARFQPSLTGSAVYSGALALEDALGLLDGAAITLGQALAAIGVVGEISIVPPRPDAYVELHVEQGRKLLEAGRRIGVVEGTWAARKITARWIGRAAHTGPTPMPDRRDALLAAARGIVAFEDVIAASHSHLHRSAARLVVEPNSPNVIVDRATAWFELRGLDVEELSRAGRLALSAFEKAAEETGTRLEIVADMLRDPASMDVSLAGFVSDIARRQGFEPLAMRSVAGHDAVVLQNSGIPSALIFIPSVDGIAHHPDELTDPEDVQAGVKVLTAVLQRLVEERHMQDDLVLHTAFVEVGIPGATLSPPIGGVVSPIHRAVENQCCFAVGADGSRVFVKRRHDDMADFVKTERVVEASRAAGSLNIAPKLLFSDTASSVLIFEALGDDWKWGHVDVLRRSQVLENLLAAKRTFHAAAPLAETRSVFDLITSYRQIAAAAEAILPSQVAAVASEVDRIAWAIAASGVDAVPCHADGASSNVMVGLGGVVQLVDFEWARQADPAYDLGTVLAELFPFDGEALLAIEMATGKPDSQTLARARLFGAADDLMWALWGFICAAHSSRKNVEFFKYAEWRLLRARAVVKGSRFETWLKQV